MHRLWSWAKKHVGIIRPTGNTCKQILIYMTRFMSQIISVVSSIQVEAVSLTHYFIVYNKWRSDFGFSVTFMKAVSLLKKVFLKCEHGAEF